MTDQLRQAAQQALEAMEGLFKLPNQLESGGVAIWRLGGSDAPRQAITALRTALEQSEQEPTPWRDMVVVSLVREGIDKHKARELADHFAAQPEFIKHEVENADDWSEWVCPDPKNYLMKCCDCGLVHEAQFGVVRYKSETEDCDIVDDPNLQAVFRMRRSEEWTPEDTAHRAGGLPMAQPMQEPVAWAVFEGNLHDMFFSQEEAQEMAVLKGTHAQVRPLYTSPPQRPWQGLTDEEIDDIYWGAGKHDLLDARAIEATLKEKNHG